MTYLQPIKSYRDGARVRQRVIAMLGREEEFDPAAIERLIRSMAKYAGVDVRAGNVLAEVELLPGMGSGRRYAIRTTLPKWREAVASGAWDLALRWFP